MKICTIYGNMAAERTSENYPQVPVCEACIQQDEVRAKESEGEDAKIVNIVDEYDPAYGDSCEFCGKTIEDEHEENHQ